jgi:hypothetical protein
MALKWSEDVQIEAFLSEMQTDLDSAKNGEKQSIDVYFLLYHYFNHRPGCSIRLVQTLQERDVAMQSTGLVSSSLTISSRDLVSGASGSTENLTAWTNYIRSCQCEHGVWWPVILE